MLSQIKGVMCYCLLLPAAAIGSTGVKCTARDRRNLICNFPFNLNSTQRDFGVYFYPDDGGEEPLVDCAWAKSQLRCIQQPDFECKHPVSEIAEITIPESFEDRIGYYRCVPAGHRHRSVKSCRPPDERERERTHSTACYLTATPKEREVTVNCHFSLPVHRFTVKQNETVVGSFTKSDCENSTVCQYSVKGKHNIFEVKINFSQNVYGDIFCHADHPSLHKNIKGCTLPNDANDQSSAVPVLRHGTSWTLVSGAVGVLCTQRNKG